jgi:hypothetical protein
MSRHAGFVPAARFEVASETDSFREGREASDGDGAGGSRDAVPPPRPTGVPAAVLSGERARPADFGDGPEAGRSRLAPTHPSSDVPRWQTHLTPMQQWELRLRGAASLGDVSGALPNARPPNPNVANHPRLALQRQHEHARRRRAKDGMAQTLDLLERAERSRVEEREKATASLFASFSSFAKDSAKDSARSRASFPASPEGEGSKSSSPDDERVGAETRRVPPNDRESGSAGPDPFVALFDAATRGGARGGARDEADASDASDASVASETSDSPSSASDTLETPFLDALVARVTRPKGSVLAELSAVDALWDGRSVARAAKADRGAYGSGVSLLAPPSPSGGTARQNRPQSARRFLERRLSRMAARDQRPKTAAGASANRNVQMVQMFGAEPPGERSRVSPRVDAERTAEPPPPPFSAVPFSDLERIEAFASSTAASRMYAKDVATFRDARKEACDALAAAEALGRAYRSGNSGGENGANGGNASRSRAAFRTPGDSDADSDSADSDSAKENASRFSRADWDRVRPSVRYVAAYEMTSRDDGEGPSDDRARTLLDEARGSPLSDSHHERKDGGANDETEALFRNGRSDERGGSVHDLPPFETLPLHFSVKERPLYAKYDFKELKPPPPPPRQVLRGAFQALGVRVDPAAFADPEGRKPSRRRREAYNLADASSAVATKMDGLMDALRVRDMTAAIQQSRRTAEDARRCLEASARVASVHESAAARFAKNGDATDLNVFHAATALAVSECLDDVMDATRWWYGKRVRLACVTIQAGFRGARGRKLARVRRKGLLAGLAYLRDCVKKVRFERWRENARRARRHAMITAMQDRKRVWSRRADAFKAWRHRTQLAKRFHEHVERLAYAARVKRHQAPAFVAWRVVAERRARQRTAGAELRQKATRRSLRRALARWSEVAAACARARVLDTAAHARAAARAVESFEQTEAVAAAAWAAAAEAGRAAARGSFVEARRFAERSRVLGDEARSACAAAEQHALESGPDAGPGSRARRAYAAFAAAKESSLRASAAAAAAAKASDFKHAARLFYGRVISRRVFAAWSAHVAWLVPLRERARKAAHFFRRSTCGSAFHAWKGEAARAKAEREAAAIRAYADIHRRLVAKHVRAPSGASGARVLGAPDLTRSRDTNAATELKRLKRLAGSVVGAGDRSRRLVETGAKKAGPSASDGPSAAAARAEARRAADAEKAAANKKLDVQRRAREWNSR